MINLIKTLLVGVFFWPVLVIRNMWLAFVAEMVWLLLISFIILFLL